MIPLLDTLKGIPYPCYCLAAALVVNCAVGMKECTEFAACCHEIFFQVLFESLLWQVLILILIFGSGIV
jgi:hypothetical protein